MTDTWSRCVLPTPLRLWSLCAPHSPRYPASPPPGPPLCSKQSRKNSSWSSRNKKTEKNTEKRIIIYGNNVNTEQAVQHQGSTGVRCSLYRMGLHVLFHPQG